MKKIILVAAVLVGAVTAAQAGVHFNIGIGIPLPPPVVVRHPAPVYCPPPVYAPCPPPVVVLPRPWTPVVVAPPHHGHGYRHGHPPHHPSYRYEERWSHRGHGSHGRYEYRERWNDHHR